MGVGRDDAALKPAVFFDRDGVLNAAVVRDGKPYPPTVPEELAIDSDAARVVADLRARGFMVVVVTNQPDVARGTTTAAAVDAINERLRAAVGVDAVYTCVHDNQDGCACRKPKPGMLLRAARELGLDLDASYMVGDRWSDIEAGRRARCRTVWIERSYAECSPVGHDAGVASLTEAWRWICDDSTR